MSNPPINYELKNPDIHKSIFENDGANTRMNTKYDRTLLSVQEEREQILSGKNVSELISPGKFSTTIDDSKLSKNSNILKGTQGETPLTFLFFSEENVINLQNNIRFLVHKHTSHSIDNQSNNELLVVMRSMYLMYPNHPELIDSGMSEERKSSLYKEYKEEVGRLNDLVLNDVVPRVVSNLQQYIDYLHDASSPRHIIEIPKSDSRTGTRQYRSTTSVLTGGVL